MIRFHVEHSLQLLRLLLYVRPGRHTRRWGWVVFVDDEPTEWHRRLVDAVQALQMLIAGRLTGGESLEIDAQTGAIERKQWETEHL